MTEQSHDKGKAKTQDAQDERQGQGNKTAKENRGFRRLFFRKKNTEGNINVESNKNTITLRNKKSYGAISFNTEGIENKEDLKSALDTLITNVNSVADLLKDSAFLNILEEHGAKISNIERLGLNQKKGFLHPYFDDNLTLKECIFEPNSTIFFKGTELTISNCILKEGVTAHLTNGNASLIVEHSTLPQRISPKIKGNDRIKARENAFKITGTLKEVIFKHCNYLDPEYGKCHGGLFDASLANIKNKIQFLDSEENEIQGDKVIRRYAGSLINSKNLKKEIEKAQVEAKRNSDNEKYKDLKDNEVLKACMISEKEEKIRVATTFKQVDNLKKQVETEKKDFKKNLKSENNNNNEKIINKLDNLSDKIIETLKNTKVAIAKNAAKFNNNDIKETIKKFNKELEKKAQEKTEQEKVILPEGLEELLENARKQREEEGKDDPTDTTNTTEPLNGNVDLNDLSTLGNKDKGEEEKTTESRISVDFSKENDQIIYLYMRDPQNEKSIKAIKLSINTDTTDDFKADIKNLLKNLLKKHNGSIEDLLSNYEFLSLLNDKAQISGVLNLGIKENDLILETIKDYLSADFKIVNADAKQDVEQEGAEEGNASAEQPKETKEPTANDKPTIEGGNVEGAKEGDAKQDVEQEGAGEGNTTTGILENAGKGAEERINEKKLPKENNLSVDFSNNPKQIYILKNDLSAEHANKQKRIVLDFFSNDADNLKTDIETLIRDYNGSIEDLLNNPEFLNLLNGKAKISAIVNLKIKNGLMTLSPYFAKNLIIQECNVGGNSSIFFTGETLEIVNCKFFNNPTILSTKESAIIEIKDSILPGKDKGELKIIGTLAQLGIYNGKKQGGAINTALAFIKEKVVFDDDSFKADEIPTLFSGYIRRNNLSDTIINALEKIKTNDIKKLAVKLAVKAYIDAGTWNWQLNQIRNVFDNAENSFNEDMLQLINSEIDKVKKAFNASRDRILQEAFEHKITIEEILETYREYLNKKKNNENGNEIQKKIENARGILMRVANNESNNDLFFSPIIPLLGGSTTNQPQEQDTEEQAEGQEKGGEQEKEGQAKGEANPNN
ncbi:MAG: hypothetical protein ACOX3T_00095 [Bdellovibrionota bacterium]